MPDFLKHPVTWAILGATLLLGAGVAVATRGNDSDVGLSEPSLTATAGDLTDNGPISTAVVGDVPDSLGVGPPGSTTTVFDVDDERPGAQLGALAIVDETSECLWLVDIPGESPQKLFVVAWPTGTEIAWDPFQLLLPGLDEPLFASDRIAADATVFDAMAELSDSDTPRVLGLERCEHEGVLVMDDRADNIQVTD